MKMRVFLPADCAEKLWIAIADLRLRRTSLAPCVQPLLGLMGAALSVSLFCKVMDADPLAEFSESIQSTGTIAKTMYLSSVSCQTVPTLVDCPVACVQRDIVPSTYTNTNVDHRHIVNSLGCPFERNIQKRPMDR